MSQRQQLLLQQLGIRQWITREQYVERKRFDLLWRDQHETADADFYVPQGLGITAQPEPPQSLTIPPVRQAGVDTSVPDQIQTSVADAKRHHVELTAIGQTAPQQADVVAQPDITAEVRGGAQEIAFDYQIVLHDKFVIFAEVDDSLQRKLLHNIQNACFAEQSQLKWPLNIRSWDSDDQLVHSYLQGFFAIHRSKLIIILGEDELLPSLCAGQFQQFNAPSLQQMIETPTQKRVLWQKIYPLIYDIEQSDEKESRDL